MLRAVAGEVHSLAVPFRMGAFDLGGRMTVIRLPGGGLWVHSPVACTPEARATVDALGPVRFLVAPNLMHHLRVGEWAAAYPEARVVAPASLRAKRKDLRIDLELGDAADAGWAGVIDQVQVKGMPKLDEFVFFHRPTGTVLLTDLAFNFHQTGSWLTRTYLKLCGAWQRLAPTFITKAVVKDRVAVKASLERVLAWDVKQVVVCHGDVQETGAREALREAFHRLAG
ncbi:DUF4336 domain-containing protein [Myxococcus sp. CA051A]|uniref:DUF4336 domain-containing protein n=1 Tax=unclassified Myxococcus TaxID=2648731 RepID=UPI00157A9C83|nr:MULTISPECIES: DUF4336 domain-containing protein [unclassified Myxococcus]NTX11502.1 DUF4336 domain-containing protein [Myxococcus sp. CA056]NTX60773.1 DUF4336 domain-containing protein [Myxococcus sp. CA051A]